MLTDTKKSPYAKVAPIDCGSITMQSGFWKDITQTVAHNTVPHLLGMFEDNEISHVLENFRICAGDSQGEHAGTVFGDGDFYKWMESALYAYAETQDEALLTQLEGYCDLISRAQLDDGYISTKQIIGERQANGTQRMGDVNDFEIYNMGHLFTTACLYLRVTGKDTLLRIARKAANYIEYLYNQAKEKGEVKTAVCPSHYMGLIELYRTTEDIKYLQLAQLAIELRDSVADGTDDNQDRIPLKEHTKIVGHAVRSNYLYAGVADLYAETGDSEYLDMLHRVWHNLVTQKLYITGGCGALYSGVSPYGNFFVDQKVHQAYGYEYQLPNITAYNESCASVGLVLWAYRMFLIEPKSEYMDIIERAMLNVNLAAISIDGQKYFYENPLERTKDLPYKLVWPLHRTEYIFSYCCPPNIARTLAQVSEYFYTTSNNSIWCGLYGANTATIALNDQLTITLEQKTAYPYNGDIALTITDIQGATEDTRATRRAGNPEVFINIRVPHWVASGSIKTAHTTYNLAEIKHNGYIEVPLQLIKGETITITFDMPARYTRAHEKVEELRNQVVVERGPMVYCIESEDVATEYLSDIFIDQTAVFTPKPYTIAGREVQALVGNGYVIQRSDFTRQALYQSVGVDRFTPVSLRLVPYFAWDNRGQDEMKTWLPVVHKDI